jgi:PIN domain nuclease of toxin-antitoxin system
MAAMQLKRRNLHMAISLREWAADVKRTTSAGKFVAAHKDPFDRMIAALALALDISILSPDPHLDQFGIRRIW